ncbi:MAG: alpha/beta hydrolase [Gemmatimonadales bacterium]
MTVFAFAGNPVADTSPHIERSVSIEPGVSLEVLEWGGHGPPVVLLTGIGNTAHVYDDLAPRLARDFHVFGITRRGYGRSSAAPSGLTIDRLAEDVAIVLDSLHLDRPVLIGHSLGTMELVVLGTRRSARLHGLVFLDGPYDDGYPDILAAVVAFDSLPLPPRRTDTDRASYRALQAADVRRDGYTTPIGEYEARYARSADGLLRSPPGGIDLDSVWATIPFPLQLQRIPVPALAIYSLWEGPVDRMVPYFPQLDSTEQAAARALHARWAPGGRDEVRRRQMERFRHQMPHGEAVGISGAPHYAFLSHTEVVYRYIHRFLRRLKE